MTEKLGQDPAFPAFEYNENGYGDSITLYIDGQQQHIPFTKGMSKRLVLAGILMSGRISRTDVLDLEETVSTVYKMVDELLKQEDL
jgi:hypothetical protein